MLGYVRLGAAKLVFWFGVALNCARNMTTDIETPIKAYYYVEFVLIILFQCQSNIPTEVFNLIVGTFKFV